MVRQMPNGHPLKYFLCALWKVACPIVPLKIACAFLLWRFSGEVRVFEFARRSARRLRQIFRQFLILASDAVCNTSPELLYGTMGTFVRRLECAAYFVRGRHAGLLLGVARRFAFATFLLTHFSDVVPFLRGRTHPKLAVCLL